MSALDALVEAACVPLDGAHVSGTLERADALLASHPALAGSSIHAAAILGDADAVRRHLSVSNLSVVAAIRDQPEPATRAASAIAGALGGALIAAGAGVLVFGVARDQAVLFGVGASLIWDSPFGPLRGDAAYVISKAPTDNTQILALTLNGLL